MADRTLEALSVLRSRVAELLDLIDTSVLPDPHGIIPPGERRAGVVWKPGGKWRIRVLDDDSAKGEFVYVTNPELAEYGDFEAMTLAEARKLAMALLSACNWAATGNRLGRQRPLRVLDAEDRLTGRTFICGRADG
jgi:hypothetical protein